MWMFINYWGQETEQTTKDSTEMKNEFVFLYIFFYEIKYKSISLLCSKLFTSTFLLIEGHLIHTKKKNNNFSVLKVIFAAKDP